MANALYTAVRDRIMSGEISFSSDTLKVVLLTADYTFSAAHDYLNDIDEDAIVATASLSLLSVANGVFDSHDVIFPLLTGDDDVVAMALYKQGDTDAESPLIAFYDTATGLPFLPDGGDATIEWDASGIIQLSIAA